jgi:hypothetical protein
LPRATAGGSGNCSGGSGLAGIKLELGERLALGYQFHIASSREQAIREAAPHYEENMKMFDELRLVRALTDSADAGCESVLCVR